MQASNTPRAYGRVARLFHWSIAFLILSAIGLGLYAGSLPRGTQEQMAAIFQAFSVHKTLGVAVLLLGALRILWSLTQVKPRPLHPERRLESFAAEAMHWELWIGMILIPLSGWLLHSAAPGGFSRILWPLGQRLPLVPEDAALAERFAAFHTLSWWILAGLVLLHVAGALKHALIDRDGTMSRMAGPAARAPEPPPAQTAPLPHLLAALAGLAIWGATALAAAQPDTEAAEASPVVAEAPAASGWAVQQGSLNLEVTQSGSAVAGQFGKWDARIDYDPEAKTGHVAVQIDIASLTLGAVSDSAKGPDFLNAAAHPLATFDADILAEGAGHVARGTLTIAGKSVPAELPFVLAIEGDTATASGEMRLDRRDFGVGAGYADESTVGFGVRVHFELTAQRP